LEKVLTEDTDVEALLEALLKNYEHGLKLIRKKPAEGVSRFPGMRWSIRSNILTT